MMRIFKCMMVDFIKVKKKMVFYLVLIPLACILMMTQAGSSVWFILIYCLFAAIILAGIPYYNDKIEEIGFMDMLPVRPGEQIWGHFLFGAAVVLMSYLAWGLCIAVSTVFQKGEKNFYIMDGIDGVSGAVPAFRISLLIIGGALVFIAIQDFIFSVFRFQHIQAVNVVRMIPAFFFFFGLNIVLETGSFTGAEKMIVFLYKHSVWLFLACIFFFLLSGWISSRIERKKRV